MFLEDLVLMVKSLETTQISLFPSGFFDFEIFPTSKKIHPPNLKGSLPGFEDISIYNDE